MSECIFCKIVSGDIPADIVYEDEHTYAFNDINPQAPCHILIIPKKHCPNLQEMDEQLMGALLKAARDIASKNNYDDEGYRLVINTGESAGQSVFHTHVHLLSGRRMRWPPG